MLFEDIWFSSDLHFYHKKIQQFCPTTRSQGTLEEMNEGIIAAHNARVKPHDTWYHMGDFSFGSFHETVQVLNRMNGKKKFFKGNHDSQLSKVIQSVPSLVHSYEEYRKTKIGDHRVILMHYPIESWDTKSHGAIHIHGHLHGDSHHECKVMKNRFDVGIDNRTECDMAPFHFDEVIERIKKVNAVLDACV